MQTRVSKETDETISFKAPQQGTHFHYVVHARLTRQVVTLSPQYSTPASFRTVRTLETLPYDPNVLISHLGAQDASLERQTVPTITNNFKALPSFLHRSIRTSMIAAKASGPVGGRPCVRSEDRHDYGGIACSGWKTPKDVRMQL